MSAALVLRSTDIEPEPGSILDPSGQLFRWNGRLFRSIREAQTWSLYSSLLESSKARQDLTGSGLVDTWIPQDVQLEGAAGLLEHRIVDFVSSRPEWTLRMLWEAARCSVRCAAALSQRGLALKDCHPWNILFDFCQPRLVDFGSVVPKSEPSAWLNELRVHFILPLWLVKAGGWRGRIVARDLMREHLQGLGTTLVNWPRLRWLPYRFKRLVQRYQHALRSGDSAVMGRFFSDLQAYIDRLEPTAPKETWSAYDQGQDDPSAGQKSKQDRVLQALRSLNCESLLDMGANKGWYAFSAEALGYKVVAFDLEESNVDLMYLRGQTENRRVLPLQMDFLHPSPESGLGLTLRNSFDRLRCDVALVLGLVHHLALHQGVSFDFIARVVDRYTRNAAVIEFVSPEDEHIRNWTIPADYSIDNFLAAMNHRGFQLETQDPLIPGRHLLSFTRTAVAREGQG